jgi:stage IV sporulation protein FB
MQASIAGPTHLLQRNVPVARLPAAKRDGGRSHRFGAIPLCHWRNLKALGQFYRVMFGPRKWREVLAVNLLEPERSQFDWSFRLFGIDVRVQPMFWLVTLLLGYSVLNRDDIQVPTRFFYLFLWIGAAFVSILVHEMGHVVMGNTFGSRGYIVLTGFFGLAIGSSELSSRWQRIAVSFAGPLAGFLFMGGVLLICGVISPDVISYLLWPYLHQPLTRLPDWPDWTLELLTQLVWINLMWGLVNLLPIWPLDGGKISRELCQEFMSNGVKVSLIISLITAALFSINSVVGYLKGQSLIPYLPTGSVFSAIFFGIFAFTSWQMLQQLQAGGGGGGSGRRWVDEDYDRRAPWEQDADWWKRGR